MTTTAASRDGAAPSPAPGFAPGGLDALPPLEVARKAETVGVADRNTLAGIVRALMGAEEYGVPLVVGARLGFTDGTELIVFPRDRAAYGRLCRLLSLGKSEVFSGSSPLRSNGEGDRPGDSAGVEGAAPADEVGGPLLRPAPRHLPIGADGEETRIEKAETRLTFEQAAGLGEGMIALAPAPERPDAAFETRLRAWRRAWPDDLYLAASPL